MLCIDPRGGANRYSCNYSFFKKWSNEMAYVLGFLYADGDIINAKSSRTQYIKFSSIDKVQIALIKRLLGSKHIISERPPKITTFRNGSYLCKRLYFLRIGSRVMYNDLVYLGLTPKKSNTIDFPKVPKKYLNHFVRGYFDGDGHVSFSTTKGSQNQTIIKHLRIYFTSGSIAFLQGLNKYINQNLKLNNKKIYNYITAYNLQYSTQETIILFKYLYGQLTNKVYMDRKFKVFIDYFKKRPCKIDTKISRIISNLS